MATLIGEGKNQVPINGMLGNMAWQDKSNLEIDSLTIYKIENEKRISNTKLSSSLLSMNNAGHSNNNYYGSGLIVDPHMQIDCSDWNNPNQLYNTMKEGKMMGIRFSTIGNYGYNQGGWIGSVSHAPRNGSPTKTPDIVFGVRTSTGEQERMRIDSFGNLVVGSYEGFEKLQVLGNQLVFNDDSLDIEKVLNWDFADGTAWTFNDGWEWDSVNLSAYHNPANAVPVSVFGGYKSGVLSQDIGCVANEIYKIQITVSGLREEYNAYEGGTIWWSLGGHAGRYIQANGTFTFYVRTDNSEIFTMTPTDTFDGHIESVSVKKILGGNIIANGKFTGGGSSGLSIDLTGNVITDSSLSVSGDLTVDGDLHLPGVAAQTTDPLVAGQVWSNAGVLTLSAG